MALLGRSLLALCFAVICTAGACAEEVLIPTRALNYPTRASVDGTGVWRVELYFGGHLSMLIDAQTLLDRNAPVDVLAPNQLPAHLESDSPDRRPMIGLAGGGSAAFESGLGYVVRDAAGAMRWQHPALAGAVRIDGSGSVVVARTDSLDYCEISATGSELGCGSLGPYPYASSVEIALDARGGALVVWNEHAWTLLSGFYRWPRLLAARLGPRLQLRWQQTLGETREFSRDLALLGEDALIALNGRRGSEIVRLSGADGHLIWRHYPQPPNAGQQIYGWEADGEGIWLLWWAYAGSTDIERIDAKGESRIIASASGTRTATMAVFPGRGVAVWGALPNIGRHERGSQLNWYNWAGQLRWRLQTDAGDHIRTVSLGRDHLLLGLQRGHDAPSTVLQQRLIETGSLQRSRSFERLPMPALYWETPISVGEEMWVLASSKLSPVTSESVLVRVTPQGVRYQHLPPANYGCCLQAVGRSDHTGATMQTSSPYALHVLDRQGSLRWSIDTARVLRSGQLASIDGERLQGLLLGADGVERLRWDDHSGALLDRQVLLAPGLWSALPNILQQRDGSAVLVLNDPVLHLDANGTIRAAGRLPTPDCTLWFPLAGAVSSGMLLQRGAWCMNEEDAARLAWINSAGQVIWTAPETRAIRALQQLGSDYYALSYAESTSVAQLDPEAGAVLADFPIPGGYLPIDMAMLRGNLYVLASVLQPPPPRGPIRLYAVLEFDLRRHSWRVLEQALPEGHSASLRAAGEHLYLWLALDRDTASSGSGGRAAVVEVHP